MQWNRTYDYEDNIFYTIMHNSFCCKLNSTGEPFDPETTTNSWRIFDYHNLLLNILGAIL